MHTVHNYLPRDDPAIHYPGVVIPGGMGPFAPNDAVFIINIRWHDLYHCQMVSLLILLQRLLWHHLLAYGMLCACAQMCVCMGMCANMCVHVRERNCVCMCVCATVCVHGHVRKRVYMCMYASVCACA